MYFLYMTSCSNNIFSADVINVGCGKRSASKMNIFIVKYTVNMFCVFLFLETVFYTLIIDAQIL